MSNLYKHPYHGHLRVAATAPVDYVEVSLASIGTAPSTVAPLYRALETSTPTIWHPHRYHSGAPEQEGFQNGYSNAVIYAYKRSTTLPTDNPGGITYSFSTASITTTTLANGWSKSIGDTTGDFSLHVISIPAASQSVTETYLASAWGAPTLLAQSATDSLTVLLSNPSHAIPTDSAGANGNYTGSGTEVRVYEGSTELAYNGVGTTAGTWNATLTGTGITAGSKTDSGAYLTIGNHSAITTDVATVGIVISGKRIDGTSFTFPTTLQSLNKSKAGADGVGGPTVSITSSRPTTFTYTDGVFDSGQSNIVLTATVNNLASPTLSWTFQGFEINPTDSGTTAQTITSAQLGVMRSAKVSITADGIYVDTITIVRLDKSTAVAGATRNVFRGAWLTATSYAIGDIVLDANGYGWSCLTAHTSSGGVTPPTFPVTSNVNWTIYTVKGDSSTNGFLTNEVHTVPTAADGTGASYASAGGIFKVSYGTLDVTTSATFAISGGTDGGATWSKVQNGLTLTLNETTGAYSLSGGAWTSDSEAFTLTATYASATVTKVYTISKAKGGSAGTPAQYVTISGEQVFKYLASAATPVATSITLSASLFGGLTLYSWQYWTGSAWSNLSGTQNTSSYTLAYDNAAWSASSLRVRCLSGSAWDEYTIVKLYDGAEGTPGSTGTRTAILDMYLWSGAVPTVFPSGASTYTWATGQFTAPATTNSWALVPGIPSAGQTLYICRQIFSDNLTTSTSSVSWTATTSMVASKAGTDGSPGANGQRTGILEVYIWSASAPATYPGGTSTYTWTTGSFTAPSTANGWSLIPGAGSAGQTLWAVSVIVTDNLTTGTSTATWNSTTVYPIGYFGTNGGTGATGQSARSAYIVTTSATVPSATAGSGDVVPTNVPAGTVLGKGWNFTAYSTLAVGEYQYRVDGLYTVGGNIAWGNAYLNYLKVGSLSALSADLGTVSISSVGSLASTGKTYGAVTAGFFLGYSGGAYKLDIGDSSKYIRWTGSDLLVNGQIIDLVHNAVPGSLSYTDPMTSHTLTTPLTTSYALLDTFGFFAAVTAYKGSINSRLHVHLAINNTTVNNQYIELYADVLVNGSILMTTLVTSICLPEYGAAYGTPLGLGILETSVSFNQGDTIQVKVYGKSNQTNKVYISNISITSTVFRKQ